MLAPHPFCWHSSNYLITRCFTMFHICQTIRRHFSLRQVKLCIGQRKYKQKFTTQERKEWPTNRPSEWIRTRSLNSYFAFCKIVVKMSYFCLDCNYWQVCMGLWKPGKSWNFIDKWPCVTIIGCWSWMEYDCFSKMWSFSLFCSY